MTLFIVLSYILPLAMFLINVLLIKKLVRMSGKNKISRIFARLLGIIAMNTLLFFIMAFLLVQPCGGGGCI